MNLSNEGINKRIENYLSQLDDMEKASVSVCAVIEMGLLTKDKREKLIRDFDGYPWFHQPKFQALKPLGPWFFKADIEKILSSIYPLSEAGFHGVTIIHKKIEKVSKKLGEFCLVQDEAGGEQLLRFYDPYVFSILNDFSEEKWYQPLFSSFSYWWLPKVDGWEEYLGQETVEIEEKDNSQIVLTPKLINALGSDPLTHQILGQLEKTSPSIFKVDCPAIRLALVDDSLKKAKKNGLTLRADLVVYVIYSIAYGDSITQKEEFKKAVDETLTREVPLSSVLEKLDQNINSEITHG